VATAIGNLVLRAVELLPTASIDERSLPDGVQRMVRLARQGDWPFNDLTARSLPKALSDAVTLAGVVAVAVADRGGQDRLSAGVAASLVCDVGGNGDVWGRVAAAHADRPAFAAALLAGIVKEYSDVPVDLLEDLLDQALEAAEDDVETLSTFNVASLRCYPQETQATLIQVIGEILVDGADIQSAADVHGWSITVLAVMLVVVGAAAICEEHSTSLGEDDTAGDWLSDWLDDWEMFAEPSVEVHHGGMGMPNVSFAPGMAEDLMSQLRPLLEQQGIRFGHPEAPPVSMEDLQAAMGDAMSRHNLGLFTPVDGDRDVARMVLVDALTAFLTGDDPSASLEASYERQPESLAWTIGVATGALDRALGTGPDGPKMPSAAALVSPDSLVSGPVGSVATDLLSLGRKGRANRSIDAIIRKHGGYLMYEAAAAAVFAVTLSWAAASPYVDANSETAVTALLARILD
jgi:hypothetical protein